MSSSTKSPYVTFITHFISLISLSLTKWPDQRLECGGKTRWLPTCVAPKSLCHTNKGSDTWSRKKDGASPVEPVMSPSVLSEWLGLQPNLGCVGGSETDAPTEQPARGPLFTCIQLWHRAKESAKVSQELPVFQAIQSNDRKQWLRKITIRVKHEPKHTYSSASNSLTAKYKTKTFWI